MKQSTQCVMALCSDTDSGVFCCLQMLQRFNELKKLFMQHEAAVDNKYWKKGFLFIQGGFSKIGGPLFSNTFKPGSWAAALQKSELRDLLKGILIVAMKEGQVLPFTFSTHSWVSCWCAGRFFLIDHGFLFSPASICYAKLISLFHFQTSVLMNTWEWHQSSHLSTRKYERKKVYVPKIVNDVHLRRFSFFFLRLVAFLDFAHVFLTSNAFPYTVCEKLSICKVLYCRMSKTSANSHATCQQQQSQFPTKQNLQKDAVL